ncbi:16S rRNA (uracil(1498)-N(3))-methyltransferase [Pseudooceanicola sp.]|uniref:16S rRNA (uracil(1498)-N(3))-methyltransferase n=1 Tax=Pseudooceanicola sp. TaxID=1914328 RepID=UPI00260C83C1|nr:16S rRNA (uracil(1498)-N(3))-methyltransferase [Pseudooceanicola sp.]MDF1856521.1 16S rRNA (uracil(1498)-N(3))-methyltransferase [Pseudooceanicola sp.]
MSPRVRLHVDHPLGAAQTVPLDRDQAHYLFAVMRLNGGDAVALFNGRDGEWLAQVAQAGKRGGALICLERTAALKIPPDLWLIFAPIKKARTDFIVEKAVELGARRILPVQSTYTNSERIRRDRLQTHAVEAAEQSGATFVPEVAELERLERLLDGWPAARQLMFCDEALARQGGSDETPFAGMARGAPWAILIGPEGGFSEAERRRLAAMPQAVAVRLGPRILRADTAAVAALTLWQSALGDW